MTCHSRILRIVNLLYTFALLASYPSPTFAQNPIQKRPTKPVELGLNDVSILLPYQSHPELFTRAPELDGQSFVPAWLLRKLSETTAADHVQRENEAFDLEEKSLAMEELERAEYMNLLPKEVRTGGEEGIYADNSLLDRFRLTSLRIDPCANVLSINGEEANCRAELRLVWQAVRLNPARQWIFVDSNIHSIYRLSAQDFADVLKTMRSLRASYQTTAAELHRRALGPHIEIDREGLEGVYYQSLVELTRRLATVKNLSHLAFFAQTHAGGHWVMLKYAVKGKKATPLSILSSDTKQLKEKTVQRLTLTSFDGLGVPSPQGPAVDNLYSSKDPDKVSRNADRIENPNVHDVDDRDCASCHTADHQRRLLGFDDLGQAGVDAYHSQQWNLEARFPAPSFVSLQIFSFFPPRAVRIAPRVIHDSAATVDFINERL